MRNSNQFKFMAILSKKNVQSAKIKLLNEADWTINKGFVANIVLSGVNIIPKITN